MTTIDDRLVANYVKTKYTTADVLAKINGSFRRYGIHSGDILTVLNSYLDKQTFSLELKNSEGAILFYHKECRVIEEFEDGKMYGTMPLENVFEVVEFPPECKYQSEFEFMT